MSRFIAKLGQYWRRAAASHAPVARYRTGLTLAIGGVLLVSGINWFVAHRLNHQRQEIDIQVRAARMRELRTSPEYQLRRIEQRLQSPDVLFALRTSEATQVFTAAAAALVHPQRKSLALSTSHLLTHMTELNLIPPQCRYIPPTDPNNQLRVPLLISELSGTALIPFWNGRHLVVGSLPLNESDGEAFFIRYPDNWQGRTMAVMWTAPTLNHPVLPPDSPELTLREYGWVKSPLPFQEKLSDLDRTRIALDMIAGERQLQTLPATPAR